MGVNTDKVGCSGQGWGGVSSRVLLISFWASHRGDARALGRLPPTIRRPARSRCLAVNRQDASKCACNSFSSWS